MSVLSNLRDLSSMEFYKNAINIRCEITKWMLRNFGLKKNPKNIKCVLKNATPEEVKQIDEIFISHGENLNKEFTGEYPLWFINTERKIIMNIMWQMMNSIIAANSIYAETMAEADLRRCKQDKAIISIHHLYCELQYIQKIFPQNLNYFAPLLEKLEREDKLLKGWRQSDNKARKKLAEKLKHCA